MIRISLPMEMWRKWREIRRATRSLPPVVPPRMKMSASPAPAKIPPKMAASIVSPPVFRQKGSKQIEDRRRGHGGRDGAGDKPVPQLQPSPDEERDVQQQHDNANRRAGKVVDQRGDARGPPGAMLFGAVKMLMAMAYRTLPAKKRSASTV